MRSRRGRSLWRTRPVHIVPGLNISVCCVMLKSGIIKFLEKTCAFNATSFYSYIDTLQNHAETLQIGSVVIIMDNVPCHKSVSILESVENRGNLIMFLHHILHFQIRSKICLPSGNNLLDKDALMMKPNFFALIDDVQNAITPADCASYFRYMISFISRCLKRDIIIDE